MSIQGDQSNGSVGVRYANNEEWLDANIRVRIAGIGWIWREERTLLDSGVPWTHDLVAERVRFPNLE